MIQPEIVEESVANLPEYSRVPIAFVVRSVLEVQVLDCGLGGFVLSERKADPPYVKDYDRYQGEGPTRWADRWDISNWGVIAAFVDGSRVGGCVLAYDTPGVRMLEDRRDLAALWDLRVHPDFRRKGIGSRLVEAAVAWAADRQCRVLKVETQNINVPACRLYARQGFVLGSLNRFAYGDFPDETELVWYKWQTDGI